MKRYLTVGALIATVLLVVHCGGGGADSTTTEAGQASLGSLATIPSVDLSTYDSSTTTSANIAALISKGLSVSKGVSVSKGWEEDMNDVGNSSRAGCEANMQKQQVILESQMAQLDRCYPEGMETAGLITIPDGEYAYYSMTLPEMEEDDIGNMCDGIPEEFEDEKASCLAGEGGGKAGMNMKMRIGRIDGELHIDMCEGHAGSVSLIHEATYSADGSQYAASIVRIGDWKGHSESNSFSVVVDLGTDGTVTNGVVDLGTDGTVAADSSMSGGFGSGVIHFEALAEDASNRVRGAFASEFIDPMSDKATAFTGKVYSRFGGADNTGCAKFSGTGTMPPIPVSEMVPWNISEADLTNFLVSFGAEMGITVGDDEDALSLDNYESVFLCENPKFDWDNPDSTKKPMIVMTGDTCPPTATHTGIECFAISSVTQQGNFGNEVTQTFTIIDSAAVAYYDEVSAYDIDALNSDITAPAFSRNWDCTGALTEIDFMSMTPESMDAVMEPCFALEEKAFGNEGMGGYNCHEQQMGNGVSDFADEGGANFGDYGGDYGFAESEENTCNGVSVPGRLFVDFIDDEAADRYCFVGEGNCQSFVVAENVGTPDDTITLKNVPVASIQYADSEDDRWDTIVQISYGAPANCLQMYGIEQPQGFGPPPAFGGEGEGEHPGEQGYIPDACIDDVTGEPVEPNVCEQICKAPGTDCGH